MSDNLGNLTIGVVAELAALNTGLQRAATGIESFSGTATRGLNLVTQVFDTAIKVAGTFGVALSANAAVDFAKGVTLAAESLKNLASTTGSSVEELSRLSNVAAVTGTDFGTFQTLLTKMTVGLAGVGDESNASARALTFLGVSAKDPAQALQDVADKLDEYADGAGKAAIARDLFGRSGPEFIDTLHKMAEAHQIVATTTAEDARQAAELAEQMRLLSIQGTTLKDAFLREVVPSLATMATQFNENRAAGLGWFASLNNTTQTSEGLAVRISNLSAEITHLTETERDANKYGQEPLGRDAAEKIESLTKQLGVLLDVSHQLTPATAAWKAALESFRPQPGYKSTIDDAKAAAAATDSFVKSLKEQVATFGLDSIAVKEYEATLLKATASQKVAIEGYLATLRTLTDQQKLYTDTVKNMHVEAGKELDTGKAVEAGYAAQTKSAADLVDTLNTEIATFGMSTIARQRWVIEAERVKAGADGNADAFFNLTIALDKVNKLGDLTDLDTGLKKSQKTADDLTRQYQRAAASIEQSLEGALVDAFDTHGKSIAQDFAHWTEQLFAQLVLRPLLQPIASGIAGALTGGGGAAGAANTATSGLSGLSGLSGAGSLLGAGATSLFGAAAGGFGAAAGAGFSAGAATLGIASEAGVAAVGGIGSTLGALSAVAIPVIGWIAAAGALIYSLVQSGKDPSQVKGQFGVSSGTGGFEDAQSAASPFGNVGFLDAGTQQFSGQAAQSFNTLTTGLLALFAQRESSSQIAQTSTALQSANFGSLEGTFTTEDFLNKYGSQVLAQVAKTAFEVLDPPLAHVIDLFQGDAQATATFVGGLLTLHDALGKLPATIAASLTAAADGTQATLDHLNVFAQSYLAVQDLMNADPSADAAKALAAQTATLADAFNTQLDATNALIAAADGTSESLTGMANAAVATYNALVAAIAQAQQFKQQIDQMFGDTIRSLTLQTLDNQGKYNFYQTDADALKQQLDVATDPAVIKALTSRINDDINAAFGLLSPDQQKALLPQYISNIAALNTESQTLLDKYTTDATDKLNTMLDDMRTKFDAVADKLGVAGGQIESGGDKIQAAANTPQQIHVTVDNSTSAVGG